MVLVVPCTVLLFKCACTPVLSWIHMEPVDVLQTVSTSTTPMYRSSNTGFRMMLAAVQGARWCMVHGSFCQHDSAIR